MAEQQGERHAEEAFFCITTWRGGKFQELPQQLEGMYKPNIVTQIGCLMVEAARFRDEANRAREVQSSSIVDDGEHAFDEPMQAQERRKGMTSENDTRSPTIEDLPSKLEAAVEAFRDRLGVGLIACDIWGPDGLPLAGYNQQPAAVALFANMTSRLTRTLADSGFPGLGRYYMLELVDRKLVCVMQYHDHQWGCLVDLEKVNMGLLISVALPKALDDLREATRLINAR